MVSKIFAADIKTSLLRNSFIASIWWIIFYPGFYSDDSFAVVTMARTGQLSSAWSAPWAVFVRIFSLHGRYPGLVTLIFGVTLTLSLTVFVYSLMNVKSASVTSSLLTATPLVGAMGVTMWHDIPMTSGFLLVATFMIRAYKNGSVSKSDIGWLLFPGMFLSTFRLNGIPTLALLILFFMFMKAPALAKKFLVVGLVFSFLVTLIAGTAINEVKSRQGDLAVGWMQYDISCYASTPAGVGFIEKAMPGVGNTESWKSTSACIWFSDAKLTQADMDAYKDHLASAWLQLLKHDPLFLLTTHMKRHEYLVPLPVYGLPRPPFIHSTVEFADQGIGWAFPQVAEKVRLYIRVWNYASPIFAYSGAWLLFLFIAWIRTRRQDLLLIVLLGTFLTGGLFVAAAISDGRYALFTLLAGQAVAIGYVVEALQRKRGLTHGA